MFSTTNFLLLFLTLKVVRSDNTISKLYADADHEVLSLNAAKNQSQPLNLGISHLSDSGNPQLLNGPGQPEQTNTENVVLNGPDGGPQFITQSVSLHRFGIPALSAKYVPLSAPVAPQPLEIKNTVRNGPGAIQPSNSIISPEDASKKLSAPIYLIENEYDLVHYDPEPFNLVEEFTSLYWPMGIVPYYMDKKTYDDITIQRISRAMDEIEAVSCVLFTELDGIPGLSTKAWLHITNPNKERECEHEIPQGHNHGSEFVVVLGFDCLRPEEIIHTLLHGIGFKDEVTHPHRDQYVRIQWENIQPKYRHLFGIQHVDPPHKIMEYDPSSIMHFHDRAFSANGAATIASLVPGMLLTPSESLSQLDIMKLQLLFGHGCKKRQIDELFNTCKNTFRQAKGKGQRAKGYHTQYEGSEEDEYEDGNETNSCHTPGSSESEYSNEEVDKGDENEDRGNDDNGYQEESESEEEDEEEEDSKDEGDTDKDKDDGYGDSETDYADAPLSELDDYVSESEETKKKFARKRLNRFQRQG